MNPAGARTDNTAVKRRDEDPFRQCLHPLVCSSTDLRWCSRRSTAETAPTVSCMRLHVRVRDLEVLIAEIVVLLGGFQLGNGCENRP